VHNAINNEQNTCPAITSKQTNTTDDTSSQEQVGINIQYHYPQTLGKPLPKVGVANQLHGIDKNPYSSPGNKKEGNNG
jgi:hypothetical protein